MVPSHLGPTQLPTPNTIAFTYPAHVLQRRSDTRDGFISGEDVPARPGLVLSRSNRVLTLWRILRCTTAKSAHLAELASSGRNRPCTLTSSLLSSRIAAGPAHVVRSPGQPHQLCRKCLARMIWRRHISRRSRSVGRHQANRRARAWRGLSLWPRPCSASWQRGQKLMLTILFLMVGSRHGARPGPARCRSRRHQAGAASRRADEPTAQCPYRVGPAPARRVCPQAGPAPSLDEDRGEPWLTAWESAPLARRARGMKGCRQIMPRSGHLDPMQPARATDTVLAVLDDARAGRR